MRTRAQTRFAFAVDIPITYMRYNSDTIIYIFRVILQTNMYQHGHATYSTDDVAVLSPPVFADIVNLVSAWLDLSSLVCIGATCHRLAGRNVGENSTRIPSRYRRRYDGGYLVRIHNHSQDVQHT